MVRRRQIGVVLFMTGTVLQVSAASAQAPSREVLVDTSRPFAPGATEERADTPSVFVWGTYQAGIAAGWHYRFSPDASAVFSPSERLEADRIRVQCSLQDRSCDIRMPDGRSIRVTASKERSLPRAGGTPADGAEVAEAYADWVLSQLPPPPAPPAPAAPAPSAAATPAPPPPATAPPAASGNVPRAPARAVPDPAIAELQRALASRGFDPGPVDGRMGRRTRAAIEQAERAEGLPPTGRPSPALIERLARPPPASPQPTQPATAQPPPAASAEAASANQGWPHDCSVSAGYTPRYFDNASLKDRSGKTQLFLSCGVTPIPGLNLRTTAIFYPRPDQQQPWDPDFVYSIAYQITGDLSIEYGNYTGNRWPWHKDDDATGSVLGGSLRLNYKLPIPADLFGELKPGESPSLDCSASIGVAPRYFDNASLEDKSGKTQLFLSCGYTGIPRLTLRGTAIFYPIASQQQPWDPDFVYVVNYKVTDEIALEYANYTGNRWPWHDDPDATGTMLGGSFRLTYQLPF
ncbi:peptidoglycan-binding protein [Mycobacterium sp. KBS0706]|uniref:peptidoglycan-binding domain-containing protein n=1 Tax=Mycobacterium sp. KBS0706 TaxID=2578109 RepID=UPI0027D2B535|nr:peptidoglycan-binding domain-containing protein [Mycobacterium sp. KBS0706]